VSSNASPPNFAEINRHPSSLSSKIHLSHVNASSVDSACMGSTLRGSTRDRTTPAFTSSVVSPDKTDSRERHRPEFSYTTRALLDEQRLLLRLLLYIYNRVLHEAVTLGRENGEGDCTVLRDRYLQSSGVFSSSHPGISPRQSATPEASAILFNIPVIQTCHPWLAEGIGSQRG
jgi:hypothetical protein